MNTFPSGYTKKQQNFLVSTPLWCKTSFGVTENVNSEISSPSNRETISTLYTDNPNEPCKIWLCMTHIIKLHYAICKRYAKSRSLF